VREEERDEVLWTSECSPRVAGVRRGQDARLQCEMVAPTGSVLTWFKDDVPLHREVIKHSVTTLIFMYK